MSHLDLELLQAVLDGDVPPKALLRHLLDHLGEVCPDCAEALATLKQGHVAASREAGTPPAPRGPENGAHGAVTTLPDPRFVGVLDRAQNTAAEWTKKVRQEQRRARADLRELRGLPRDERPQRIEHARSRYRSRSLAELLIEESRRVVREDPAEAQSLASLVEVVLLWMPGAHGEDWARELAVTARAWEANALRVGGELRAADRRFAELRARLGRELVVSEAVHAEICSLEASLRTDQVRLDEARGLLERAAFLYRQTDLAEPLAKVLMQTATVESRSGDLLAAVEVQRQALDLLERSGSTQLFLSSLINLSLDLSSLEQTGAAVALLEDHRAALTATGMWEWPHTRVLRGRIALERDDPAEAEQLFLAARAELARRGDPIRAAVASLDLALLYLGQGRTADLRRMARAMGQVFESEDLHEEAMATLVLFQQAVAAESLTVEALRAWRRQLESGGGRAPRTLPAQPS
jgi:hypothetical protein